MIMGSRGANDEVGEHGLCSRLTSVLTPPASLGRGAPNHPQVQSLAKDSQNLLKALIPTALKRYRLRLAQGGDVVEQSHVGHIVGGGG